MAELQVTINSQGVNSSVKAIKNSLRTLNAAANKTKNVFSKVGNSLSSSLDRAKTKVFSLQSAILGLGAGYGLQRLASSAIETASAFEQFEVKLESLTKGKGLETLTAINDWALDMPVNTQAAVDAFTMMQAYGLNPTIEKMEMLVNTSAIFGEDAMPRIARALGQMKTLGKLSAEELNQMSEAGVNARKYIDELGFSFEDLQKKIAAGEIPIDRAINAIWEGLNRDYSGSAKRLQNTWKGLIATFKSYATEIARVGMGGEVFKKLKGYLKGVNEELKVWATTNKELIQQKADEYFAKFESAVKKTWKFLIGLSTEAKAGVGVGVLGAFLFGGKAGVIIGALAAIDVHLNGIISKKIDKEMAFGIIGGLLFGGVPGVILTTITTIDSLLGGPLLSTLGKLTTAVGDYVISFEQAFGPKIADTLNNLYRRFASFCERMKEPFNRFIIEAEVGFMRFKDSFGSITASLLDNFKQSDTFEAFKEMFENLAIVFGKIKESLIPLKEELLITFSNFKVFGGYLFEILKVIAPPLVKFLGVALVAALTAVNVALKICITILQMFNTIVSKLLIPGLELAWKCFEGLGKAAEIFAISLDNCLVAIMIKAKKLYDGMFDLFGRIRNMVKDTFASILEWVTVGIKRILDKIKKVTKSIKNFFSFKSQSEHTINFLGSGSETLPISRKIEYIHDLLNGLTGTSKFNVKFEYMDETPADITKQGGMQRIKPTWDSVLKLLEPQQKRMADMEKAALRFAQKNARYTPVSGGTPWTSSAPRDLGKASRDYGRLVEQTRAQYDRNPGYLVPGESMYGRASSQSDRGYPSIQDEPPRTVGITINGNFSIDARGEDVDSVTAIDQRLAELISSGRSMIPTAI